MRIVIEGPDGSGKTTLVNELVKRYNLNKVVFNKDAKKSFYAYLCSQNGKDNKNQSKLFSRIL